MNWNKINLIIILAGIVLTSCTKLEKVMLVTTGTASNIWYNSVKVSGAAVDLADNRNIKEYGFCYGKNPNVTVTNSSVSKLANPSSLINGSGFTSDLSGLTPGTKYYFKAYITTDKGTAYGSEANFTTNTLSATISDADGNTYNTLIIGTQVWLKENLKTTKYNDNTTIPNVTDNTAWYNLTTAGYCWYSNNSTLYKNTYGALYNWYAVTTAKLCPTGWHVPSATEWATLESYLGGSSLAGGKMKETGTTHWTSPNTSADNSSSFTALPGGYRDYSTTSPFYSLANQGEWWSSTSVSTTTATGRYISYSYGSLYSESANKKKGFSVRCVKD